MTGPALDLVARTVAEQIAQRCCLGCGASLAGSRLAARAASGGAVLVRIECRACGQRHVVAVEPEAGEGVARLHGNAPG